MFAVAGVSGQTGAAVANALLAAGEAVRVIVRKSEAGAAWHDQGATVAVADLTDAVALAEALRGTQGAYLLNPPRYDLADPFTQAAKVGTAIARALMDSEVPRAVLLSSVGAHHIRGTGIIGTAHQVEHALAAITTPLVLLRANYFFENWGNVLGAVRADAVLPTFLEPLSRPVPMVAVADIGTAVADLLRGPAWTGRRVIDLASFTASPVAIAAAYSAVLGRDIAAVSVPHGQQTSVFEGSGLRTEVAKAFVEMYAGINSGLIEAEETSESLRGATTLETAARALLA